MKFSRSDDINEALTRMGITCEEDFFYHFPRSYADFSFTEETHLEHKQKVVIYGRLVSNPTIARNGKFSIIRFSFVTMQANFFHVVAFNRPYLMKMLNLKDYFTLVASFDQEKNLLNLQNVVLGQMKEKDSYRPIYSLPRQIENHWFLRAVRKYLELYQNRLSDDIPSRLRQKYHLLPRYEALKKIHEPQNEKDVYAGLRVFKYQECLDFSLRTQMIRKENKVLSKKGKTPIDVMQIREFCKNLPFSLTHDQAVAIREIILDMNEPTLMYRLLQGDVGTGKTLVAAVAMYGAILRGDQAALMAPTDALARQHARTLEALFSGLDVTIVLLVGNLSSEEKRSAKQALKSNSRVIAVGTHALFSKDVEFLSLGLAVIDEQHRFGVNQRLLLSSKGEHADLLLMSATPIPRTLALTLYGDLDVTSIQQFPFEARQIKTKIIQQDSYEIISMIDDSLAKNHRVFIVAPLIEYEENRENVEKLYEEYSARFPSETVILHGKMSAEEKQEAFDLFLRGERKILISTTIIEVGIDVKNADLMIIYDATHFGLASLHQIRGRIGRDGSPSHCLLLYSSEEEDLEKLRILESSMDGFFIAEEDLRRRGPGQLNGLRQSGLPDFSYANLVQDFKMFEVARKDAEEILKHPEIEENQAILSRNQKAVEEKEMTNV